MYLYLKDGDANEVSKRLGIEVLRRNEISGRLCLYVSDETEKIREELKAEIEEVSFWMHYKNIHRELGIYKKGTAKAEVTSSRDKDCDINIVASGKTISDVKNLVTEILAGKICCTESYEEQQTTKMAELEEKLSIMTLENLKLTQENLVLGEANIEVNKKLLATEEENIRLATEIEKFKGKKFFNLFLSETKKKLLERLSKFLEKNNKKKVLKEEKKVLKEEKKVLKEARKFWEKNYRA